jgi:hypothetical protein
MNEKQLLPPEKSGETEKQSLLRPVRGLLTKKAVAGMVILAVIGALLLVPQIPQAFASQAQGFLAGQSTPATQAPTDSLPGSLPTDSQKSQAPTTQGTLAIQARPATNRSYYMTSGSTDKANHLGCAQGRADKADHELSHVILDFGAQASNGSGTFFPGTNPGIFISNRQIEKVVEAFAQGYSSCVGRTSRVTLGLDIGTNNSGRGVSFANGKIWARLVLAVRSFNAAHHLSAHVVTFGANDIESWGSASAAIQWAKGYHSGGAGNYVNFGSLDGCPPVGGCNGGWTYFDYWSVSNTSVAWVVPEIYNQAGTQATQWELLDLYSVQHHHSPLFFLGPLDQHDILPGCCRGTNNTAQAAWNQLWRALHSHRSTAQNLLFSMEIRWE